MKVEFESVEELEESLTLLAQLSAIGRLALQIPGQKSVYDKIEKAFIQGEYPKSRTA